MPWPDINVERQSVLTSPDYHFDPLPQSFANSVLDELLQRASEGATALARISAAAIACRHHAHPNPNDAISRVQNAYVRIQMGLLVEQLTWCALELEHPGGADDAASFPPAAKVRKKKKKS
jgi:hypothetical protein